MDNLAEQIAMAICDVGLWNKVCPCRDAGKFGCADELPGRMARAAIGTIYATGRQILPAGIVPNG